MISAIVRDGIDKSVAGGLAGIATAFVQESIEHMIPWLIVSAAVISLRAEKEYHNGRTGPVQSGGKANHGQDGYIFQLCFHGGDDKQGIG